MLIPPKALEPVRAQSGAWHCAMRGYVFSLALVGVMMYQVAQNISVYFVRCGVISAMPPVL